MALTGQVNDQDGYMTRRTQASDVTAAAVPVHGIEGTIVAALSVTGPGFRIDERTLGGTHITVVAAARELSMALARNYHQIVRFSPSRE